MNQTSFSQLPLTPEIRRAVEALGFATATDIQAQSIPLIQSGCDVIGRSQTGTGKTLAFGIPAVEAVDTRGDDRYQAQVLILCPTRELAVQACQELKKLAMFTEGIRCADVYGGAPMERQILRLKTANIVVGTPGRIMDHMRRKTLKLDHIKMVVLDEADEMLSMGFREDIETILSETPEDRQTILFSATMPPAILALTKTYQKDPRMVQINAKQQTVENIEQRYCNAPMGRKMDVLALILRSEMPRLCMIFCNTKRMVDDIVSYLVSHDLRAEGLHGDMNQSQRTKVMDAFKQGRTSILVATDVAARGIDVTGIDLVVNYDIPQTAEYYVHRVGRTGRAGQSGKAVTLCSGRRQVGELEQMGRMVKTEILPMPIPSPADIRFRKQQQAIREIEDLLAAGASPYLAMAEDLISRGHDPAAVTAAVLQLHFGPQEEDLPEIKAAPAPGQSGPRYSGKFQKITISVGRSSRVAPNHIVAALTEAGNLTGRQIGKIEIYDDETVVAIPEAAVEETLSVMENRKILGHPTVTRVCAAAPSGSGFKGGSDRGGFNRRRHEQGGKDYRNLHRKSSGKSWS